MIKQSYDAGYQAAFDKIAIDLASARKAYNAVVKPSLFRASIKAAPAERVLAPVGFMDKLKSNLFGAPRSSPTKPFENIKDRLSASGAMSQVRKPPRIEQPRPALRVDNQVPGAAAICCHSALPGKFLRLDPDRDGTTAVGGVRLAADGRGILPERLHR